MGLQTQTHIRRTKQFQISRCTVRLTLRFWNSERVQLHGQLIKTITRSLTPSPNEIGIEPEIVQIGSWARQPDLAWIPRLCLSRWTAHMKITLAKDIPGVHIDPQWASQVINLALYELHTRYGCLAHEPIFTISGSITISLGEGVRLLKIVSINCPYPITWV